MSTSSFLKIKWFWLLEFSSMWILCMNFLIVRVKGLLLESSSWSFKMTNFTIWLYTRIPDIIYSMKLFPSRWIQVIQLDLGHFIRPLQIIRPLELQILISLTLNKFTTKSLEFLLYLLCKTRSLSSHEGLGFESLLKILF